MSSSGEAVCMRLLHIPRLLIVWLAACCGAASGDPPSVRHVSPELEPRWKALAIEAREAVQTKHAEFEKFSGLQSVDSSEPLILAVVLVPGRPLEEFGASVVEFLFVGLTGKTASGMIERHVAVLSRFPYEDREWSVSEVISGVHTDPPLRSDLLVPEDKGAALLRYVKKIFEPGICIGAREVVIDTVVFDSSIQSLIGHPLTDCQILALFDRPSTGNAEDHGKAR